MRDENEQDLGKDYSLPTLTAIEPAPGLARLQQSARELMFTAMA